MSYGFVIFAIIIIVVGVIESRGTSSFFSFPSIRPDNRGDIDESIAYLKGKRPKKPGRYVMKESLYERYQKHFYEEDTLSAVARDMLKHLGLPNNSVPVYVVDDMEGNAAGKFYGSAIEINIQRYTRPNEVLAVLIHECMHYYMRLTRLGFSDVQKNEILTDTATIYFGFYDYIYSGYIHVGYIKDSEIRYIKKVLDEKK
ncbi:MAG: hypothetical protein K6B68_10070 [Eubacterium sp.]|nr:hypothetical protein [Eubacterium sp.]